MSKPLPLTNDPTPVVIVPAAEYADLQARLEHADDWYLPADHGKASAEAFIEQFDPTRADEWGHVAHCIQHAIAHMRGSVPS